MNLRTSVLRFILLAIFSLQATSTLAKDPFVVEGSRFGQIEYYDVPAGETVVGQEYKTTVNAKGKLGARPKAEVMIIDVER